MQSENVIFSSQFKYVRDMVKKFNIEGNSHTCTPMSISVKISSDSTNKCLDTILLYKHNWKSTLYYC
jgi:hypothetical protein